MEPTLRRATAADAEELVRLRALMFASHARGGEVAAGDPAWRKACVAELARLDSEPDRIAAYVVGAPEPGGPLVACAVGWMVAKLPSPTDPGTRRGHIGSVVTMDDHRRRGYARQCFAALMDWFATQDVPAIDLYATSMSESLYREFGFRDANSPAMRYFHDDAARPPWERVG